jgi:hypothetical protein
LGNDCTCVELLWASAAFGESSTIAHAASSATPLNRNSFRPNVPAAPRQGTRRDRTA